MIEHLTADELGSIAFRGGSLVVNGAKYTAEQLGKIAFRLQEGSTLHVANSRNLTADEMGSIAFRAKGKGSVMFS